MSYRLIIGTRQGSSWSLRPWLLMTQAGIPFTDEVIQLRQPETRANILARSPSGQVPALMVEDGAGSFTVWDSLAIAEFLAEQHPERALWPADPVARALARSMTAEMHAGFRELRINLSMHVLKRRGTYTTSDAVAADICRIVALWRQARTEFGAKAGRGQPFLFGAFSIADAFYAPVASRFVTYGVDLAAHGDDGTAAAYRDMIMALPGMQEWCRAAALEPPLA